MTNSTDDSNNKKDDEEFYFGGLSLVSFDTLNSLVDFDTALFDVYNLEASAV
jgi:hypothetical protein